MWDRTANAWTEEAFMIKAKRLITQLMGDLIGGKPLQEQTMAEQFRQRTTYEVSGATSAATVYVPESVAGKGLGLGVSPATQGTPLTVELSGFLRHLPAGSLFVPFCDYLNWTRPGHFRPCTLTAVRSSDRVITPFGCAWCLTCSTLCTLFGSESQLLTGGHFPVATDCNSEDCLGDIITLRQRFT